MATPDSPLRKATISVIDQIRLEDPLMSTHELLKRLDAIRDAWRVQLGVDPNVSWDTVRVALRAALEKESLTKTADLLDEFYSANLDSPTTLPEEVKRDLDDYDSLDGLVAEYTAFAFKRFEGAKAISRTANQDSGADPEWQWREGEEVWYQLVNGRWDAKVQQTADGTYVLNRARDKWVRASGPSNAPEVTTHSAAVRVDVEKAAHDLAAITNRVMEELTKSSPGFVKSMTEPQFREFVVKEVAEHYVADR
ncbi:MAG: hypothetical protein ACRDIC_21270 [bacterium]